MKVGMLWLVSERDEDLANGLSRAATYYAAKYGRKANLCVVHPETIGGSPMTSVGGMAVRVRTDIVRDHVWIGVEEGAGPAG